jgi:phosphatidylglycerophosphate synthase
MGRETLISVTGIVSCVMDERRVVATSDGSVSSDGGNLRGVQPADARDTPARAVIDRMLRHRKDLALAPIARITPRRVHPSAVTAAALVPGLGAALAAAADEPGLAVGLWLLNRLLDGLDGALARQKDRQSDLGAYADILLDVIVYAAIPLGIATGQDSRAAWVAAGVLLASFYVNVISWSYLSALLERRGSGASARGEMTAVTMPGGLVEGAETVVLLAIALAVPAWSVAVMWIMAAGVAVSVAQRALWAARRLEAT